MKQGFSKKNTNYEVKMVNQGLDKSQMVTMNQNNCVASKISFLAVQNYCNLK